MKHKPINFKVFIFILLLTGIGFLTVLVNACKKNSSNNDDLQIQSNILTNLPGYLSLNNVPKGFVQLGQIHNEGMDSVFNTLKAELLKSQIAAPSSIKALSVASFDYDSVLKNAFKKFFETSPKTKKALSKIGADRIAYLQNKISVNAKGSGRLQGLNAITGESSNLQILLNKVSASLDSKFKYNSMLKLKAELEAINSSAATTLSAGEANQVYAATSVGFASYQYWFKNYRKWYFAMRQPALLKNYNNDQLNHLYFIKKKNVSSMSRLRTNSTDTDTTDDDTTSDDSTYYGGELGEVTISGDEGGDSEGIIDGLTNWWSEHGATIVKEDVAGAVLEGQAGFASGWSTVTEATVMFGPEGAIVDIGGQTLVWGAAGAVGASMNGAAWDLIWDSFIH